MTTPDITRLAILNGNGELCYSAYAVALVVGVHPNDVSNIDISNIPKHLEQQAYRRVQEAQAHGTPTGVINNATYWARKEHHAEVHTDPLGQSWIAKTPEELWPDNHS